MQISDCFVESIFLNYPLQLYSLIVCIVLHHIRANSLLLQLTRQQEKTLGKKSSTDAGESLGGKVEGGDLNKEPGNKSVTYIGVAEKYVRVAQDRIVWRQCHRKDADAELTLQVTQEKLRLDGVEIKSCVMLKWFGHHLWSHHNRCFRLISKSEDIENKTQMKVFFALFYGWEDEVDEIYIALSFFFFKVGIFCPVLQFLVNASLILSFSLCGFN